MANLEKGNIVKFTDSNGKMNGGTIVGYGTENGNAVAIINTLDGKRIAVLKSSLIPVKHQRKGTVGPKIQKRVEREIREYNGKITPPADEQSLNLVKESLDSKPKKVKKPKTYTPYEIDKKILEDRIKDLESENDRLRKEIETTKCPYETEKLIRTVKALKQSISDGIILSDDKSQAIIPLLDLIMYFNNIQEEEKE